MRRAQGKGSDKDPAGMGHAFRWWIEVRELSNGSVRTLPLTEVTRICLSRKKNEAPRPNEEVLQLKDAEVTLEAKCLDDLTAQLREKYPDSTYERTLHRERDYEAEKRRADAISGFGRLIIESFMKCLSSEDAAAVAASLKTKMGMKAFSEAWPMIVDAYFYALSNPKRMAQRHDEAKSVPP